MKKKILIIEDDDSMRKVERKLLELSGYEVFEASNAKDGNALAVKEKPNLILMDIRLPSKKRGIGAAKILRKQEQTSDIPIIFVTGYKKGEETKEIQGIANSGYITKPFESNDLLKAIEKYIN
tara:strand:+ start:26 stop:394 length:369 start_codon:yes stop_codon:yes gene_type:complete